jgi:hypothetical protein
MKFLNSIDLTGNSIENVKTPTTDAQAATKAYVDAKPSGGTVILNGTGVPADALGAAGNYYLDTAPAAKILYGPKGAGPAYGPDQLPITNVPTDVSVSTGSRTYGLVFKPLVNGQVTAIRYYRVANVAANTVTLTIYQDNISTEVARSVVTNAANAPVGWAVGTLSSPVVVNANAIYRVGLLPSTGNMGFTNPLTPVSAVPAAVTIIKNCYGDGPPNPTYPGTDTGLCSFVDVVFQAKLTVWPVALKSAP